MGDKGIRMGGKNKEGIKEKKGVIKKYRKEEGEKKRERKWREEEWRD